ATRRVPPLPARRASDLIRIPSQFPTLQAAIDAYSTRTIRRGAKIVLLIESGHELVSGVTVTNGDYGHFAIRSEDAEVPVADGFTDRQSTRLNSSHVKTS